MGRFYNPVRRAFVPAFVLLAAVFASGAVILEDGFTDPAASHMKWVNSNPDSMIATVSGGSLSLNNNMKTNGRVALYTNSTNAVKAASVFTLSYVMKSVTPGKSAGVFFCRSSTSFSGYYFAVEGQYLAVYKYDDGRGDTKGAYYATSADLKASDNKLTISKNGSGVFHLFLNDVWQGTFTDTQFPSGEISFMVPSSTQASFGNFVMTDAFTTGEQRTSFRDDFNGSSLNGYWENLKSSTGPNPVIKQEGGVLKMTTGAEAASWMSVDVALPDAFEVSVEVRHMGGETKNFYGIALYRGGSSTDDVSFGINGGRQYAVWKTPATEITPTTSSVIRGSAGTTGAIFIDTLTVKKKAGAQYYEFFVNGHPVHVNFPVATFPITAAGFFSYSSMEIHYDNFYAGPEGGTSVSFGRNPQMTLRGKSVLKSAGSVFYDLRGRKRYTAAAPVSGRTLVRASGVYVNENGRAVLTDKNKK